MAFFSPPSQVELPTTVSPVDRTWSPLGNRLFRYYAPRGPVGRSVLKIGGVWRTIATPTTDQMNSADTITDPNGIQRKAVFLGGHVYTITPQVETELVAAGYEVIGDLALGGYEYGYLEGY